MANYNEISPFVLFSLSNTKTENEFFHVTNDGQIVLNPDVTLDETSKAFWDYVRSIQDSFGIRPICSTCGWWEKNKQYGIEGGFCHSGKMMQGYYLPKMSFTRDSVTFAIDIQSHSLYYTGDLYGCVHHKLGEDLWKQEGQKSGGVEIPEKEQKKTLKDYQDDVPTNKKGKRKCLK